MKNILIVAVGTTLLSGGLQAQQMSLEKIYSGQYRAKGISGISPLKSNEYYAVIEPEGIAKYAYKNLEKVDYLIQGHFEDYTLSDDGSKILLQLDSSPIYRHSFLGVFQVKDLTTGTTTSIFNGQPVQEPLFSLDGTKVAFISENNLYYQDLASGKITTVTQDGAQNKILNGLADWVYEEEFGHARQYEWSYKSDALIFVKSNETEVPEMNMPIYGKTLYPQDFKFKYPKAGEPNSVVSLWIYHLPTAQTAAVDLAAFQNDYIPKIFKAHRDGEILVATANRHQNQVDLLAINTTTHQAQKRFTEKDPAWIETDQLTLEFLPDQSFLWASERDGHRHLYWYDASGKLKKQVTKGNWEITDYYGYHPETQEVLVQTTQKGSINRVISKINIKTGQSTLISAPEGHNAATFSPDFKYFINTTSTAKMPYRYILKSGDGTTIKEIQNNDALLTKLKTDQWVAKEFFTIPNTHGDEMNAWIMKPKDFDPKKSYPLLMFQYSGPGSQQVSNAWDGGNGLWFNVLVQQGYIVACVDGRGTGYKGTAYKKATYLNLGKYEIEDQITAARWLGQQPYIDASRIGIFGWSFGGYMASLAMTKGADVFKMGIAVAPVTNWRFYDSIYTERFLRTPQENPKGYDDNSPTEFAHLLKGNFLLIHGTADDNVHYQNSAVFAEALIQQNKSFEFMTYPDKNHGIYGGKTRPQLYQKMTQFILNNL